MTGSELHFRYYLDISLLYQYSECISLLPNQWPGTQEHLEAGLVFHNPTTLQGEAKQQSTSSSLRLQKKLFLCGFEDEIDFNYSH